MTWNERRIIAALGTVLAVLFAALLIVLSIRYRENRAEQEELKADSSATQTDTTETEQTPERMFVALDYYNGATNLSFALDEESGSWFWVDDPNFPLQQENILSILEQLRDLKPQQTLEMTGEPSSYGLNDPRARLNATVSDGKVLSLVFGKATDSGESRYVQVNGSEDTVYILDDALLDNLDIPIYNMMILPEISPLQEHTLQLVSIQGMVPEDGSSTERLLTVLNNQTPGDDEASWRHEGANVTDTKLVRSLMEDIEALKIERCVIYRPSTEAADLCGFRNPAAILTLRHTATAEDGETLILYIGNRDKDETGRYIRLNEDSTIYFLPTELLDPLMRISANGLEG